MVLVPRVEGQCDLFEQSRFRRDSATDGLVYHIEIGFRADFICLLYPRPAQIPVLGRDGRDLERVIQTTEQDLLSSGLVGQLEGAFLHVPERLHTEAADSPFQVGETGVVQGAVYLADDQQVRLRVFHQVDDVPQRGGLGFFGGARAFADPVAAFEPPEGAVALADDVRQVELACAGVSQQAVHRRRSPPESARPVLRCP